MVYIRQLAREVETQRDHVDYQRLIRLDEFKEHLDDVGLYLEDDLVEAIVSKYADNAVRRVDLTEKFGNESHAFHDYMNSYGLTPTWKVRLRSKTFVYEN